MQSALAKSRKVAGSLEETDIASCLDTSVWYVQQGTHAAIQRSEAVAVGIKPKHTKSLVGGGQHQWQPDITHSDDTNDCIARLDARYRVVKIHN